MNEEQKKQNFSHNTNTITVISDRNVQPYIDTFAITPQNIIEREHGSLIGFFRIYDESKDSAYIANFLTSVLKKEFYASTRRDTETALEAALAKVNMALGELARHDSTQWIGNVDGAVCVFTKDSVCFSSCGEGSIQLFRNDRLLQVSAPGDKNASVLSTFSDIACGPLRVGDTFLIASRELMQVLPHAQCERACVRHTGAGREQLLRTALVNQTDGSCVHIIDISEAREAISRRGAAFDVGEEKVTMPENVFSAQTFAAQKSAPMSDTSAPEPNIDPQGATGHIYLQGDASDMESTPFSEVLMEHTSSLRSALRRQSQTLREKAGAFFESAGARTSAAARGAVTATGAAMSDARRAVAAKAAERKARKERVSDTQNIDDALDIDATDDITHLDNDAQLMQQEAAAILGVQEDVPAPSAHARAQDIVAQREEERTQTEIAQTITQAQDLSPAIELSPADAAPQTSEPKTSADTAAPAARVKRSFHEIAPQHTEESEDAEKDADTADTISQEALSILEETTDLEAAAPVGSTTPAPAAHSTLENFLSGGNTERRTHDQRALTETLPTFTLPKITWTPAGLLALLGAGTEKLGAGVTRLITQSVPMAKRLGTKTASAVTAARTRMTQKSQERATAKAETLSAVDDTHTAHAPSEKNTAMAKVAALLPHPRKAIALVRAMTLKQRIASFAITALIVIVPWILTRGDAPVAADTPADEVVETPQEDTQRDSSSTAIDRAFTLHEAADTVTMINLRGDIYAIAPRSLTRITSANDQQEFALPQTYGDIVDAANMDDLNMIILLTDEDEVISFTPLGATKLTTNTITFPAGLSADKISVYRTYLYFFDSNGNDIYRYARVTGGFGAAVNWLSDGTDFARVSDVAIDGSIYLADADGALSAFFDRSSADLTIPDLTPALTATALYTANEDAPLFVLDRNAGRIIAFDKDAQSITVNVRNDDLQTARNITVDSRLRTITALLDDGTIASYRY